MVVEINGDVISIPYDVWSPDLGLWGTADFNTIKITLDHYKVDDDRGRYDGSNVKPI